MLINLVHDLDPESCLAEGFDLSPTLQPSYGERGIRTHGRGNVPRLPLSRRTR